MNNDDYKKIIPLTSQNMMINAIMLYPEIPYYFFIGGYGSGKSFCIILLLLIFIKKYEDYNIKIGLGGTTLGDIEKLILEDFFIILLIKGINYNHNKALNIIKIGKITIFCLATGDPRRIYGYTLDIFLVDEIDELKKDVAELAFKAIVERTRGKNLPDRNPFMAFFTTAQGKKRATYLELKRIKEEGLKYFLVRGKTEDNPYNAKSYIENLLNIYNEEEQKAFMHGFFMDFSTGCVYPDFSEEKHIILPFDIEENETISVGQDKNIGYNKSVCIIKKDKTLYICKTFSFHSISDAPKIIRNGFPTNSIFWYPDVTAKEIIAGYANEIKSHQIHLRVGTINPGILSRVFIVNKLFKTGRMFIFKGLKELKDALETRNFDEAGMPEKINGPDCPSHICDALEYVCFRIVMSDPDFADIKNSAVKVK